MNTNQIIIKPIESREKEYLAYFKDEFMQATFCLAFKDSIFGAVSLNRFIEMIKESFEIKKIPVFVSDAKYRIKSKALIDVLTIKSQEEEIK
jgi:hypothetical protein